MRLRLVFLLVLLSASSMSSYAQQRTFTETHRFESPEARQAMAVDDRFVYAINNHAIAKHDKATGALVAHWQGEKGKPLIHLNSGIVLNDTLYAAHSNYPGVPMASSIEFFDPATLEHIGSHSFGIAHGSATWIDRRDNRWWVGFAHYDGRGGEPGKGSAWTRIMLFDDAWRVVGGYTLPETVIERFHGRSNSGAAFGPDGLLYATGHDAAEIYVLRPPTGGSVLELVEIAPITAEGQGIAWDPARPHVLYTLLRDTQTIVASQLTLP